MPWDIRDVFVRLRDERPDAWAFLGFIKLDVWRGKWTSQLVLPTDISINASLQHSRLRENTVGDVGSSVSRRARGSSCRELCKPWTAAEPSLWLLGALPSGKGTLSWDLLRCRALFFFRGCGINNFLMHKPDLNAKQLCTANTCNNNHYLFDSKIMVPGKEHFVSKQTKHL